MAKQPVWKQVAASNNDLYREAPKHSNKTLKLTLPIAPSVNSLHVNVRGGGRRLTSKAQNYIRDSKALINMATEDQRWIIPKRNMWLYVDLVFFMPDRRIRDSHNCLKLLLDVMQGPVYENDYYVLPRIQSVEYDPANPRIEVQVSYQTNNNRQKGLKQAGLVV